MPLASNVALLPADDCIRVNSAAATASRPVDERGRRVRPEPSTGPKSPAPASKRTRRRQGKEASGLAALVGEVEDLRAALRDACGRACRLLVALQRHRKQSRRVAGTLA